MMALNVKYTTPMHAKFGCKTWFGAKYGTMYRCGYNHIIAT